MKQIKTSLFIILLASCIWSCGNNKENDLPDTSEKEYILNAEVTNKANGTAEVNNSDKRITVRNIKKKEGWHNVRIKLTLAQFVYMIDPLQQENEYNLTGRNIRIKVRYGAAGGKEIAYDISIEEAGENEVDPQTKGWTETTEFGPLPEGIRIYMSPDELLGKKVRACIAVVDMVKGHKFVIHGGEVDGLRTPDDFYEEKKSPLIINGSYFYSTWNVGLLVKNGKFIRANSREVARKGPDGTDVTYYPTRGVFGLTQDGTYRVDWVYTLDNITYGYPQPSPVVPGQTPPPPPSSAYPAEGEEMTWQDAIGAGPVLVKNSEIRNTWQEEILDDEGGIQPNNNHPRTAIGITETLKMIYFVCEGRNATPDVPGMTTGNVAEIMLELGCTDALNLDGGGSTCMIVNGKQTIKTSNTNGAQRAVATVLAIE
ncbi:MAG: phosphodiester glycosidase family protein [Tannerella sp.]|jgi:hypothetical protein|nr:phosphodiester glycosidase family protein [Tannerella sp.]